MFGTHSELAAPSEGPRNAFFSILGRIASSVGLTRRRGAVAVALMLGDVAAGLASILVADFAAHQSVNLGGMLVLDLPLLVLCFLAFGLYFGDGLSPADRLRRRALALALFVAGRSYLGPAHDSLEQAVAHGAAYYALLLVTGFYVEMFVRHLLIRRGIWGSPTLIVGAGQRAKRICSQLAMQPDLGLRPVALVQTSGHDASEEDDTVSVPILGDAAAAAWLECTEVALLTGPERWEALHGERHPDDKPAPRVFVAGDGSPATIGRRVRALQTRLALDGAGPRNSTARQFFKRALDLLVAVPATIILAPVIGLVAAAIKVIDPGPAFYAQDRIGRGGRIVRIFKVRSMYLDAERRLEEHLAANPAARAEWDRFFKLREDPRILGWVGTFIRRSSLDELPQLWNVVRGDMTLVGPRPLPPYHANSYDKEFQVIRSSVTPGLTGSCQVSVRSNGDSNVLKAHDLYYLHNESFWLDLSILLQTIPAVLTAKGAR